MRKRIGILLSGCGVKDGSEIHEAVLTMLALDRAGASYVAVAPDIPQAEVVDHVTGKAVAERRNVLVESARLSRGEILSLEEVDAKTMDGLVLPGGFGAAKNLSDFAAKGEACSVHPGVAALVHKMWKAGKPIGAWCIAPAVLAKVFQEAGARPRLTIGTDPATAQALEAMGAAHEMRPATGVVVDPENRIVTTPCYMLAGRISEVADGIQAAVKELLALCEAAKARSA